MATRYWVGGNGTWASTGTTHWSAASAIKFSASCTGTALTTTGSPALVVGMTVYANDNTSLGTISSGSGNSWVVSVGGSFTTQDMTAATVGASAPTTADAVIFDANSSLVSYTVTSGASLACLTVTINGPFSGTMTLAGTNNLQMTAAGARVIRINTPSTVLWTNTGAIQFTTASGSLTLDTNGCSMASDLVLDVASSTISLSSDYTSTGLLTFNQGALSLNSRTLTVNTINMGNGSTRSLNFGTGAVYVTGRSYTTTLETGLSFVGTPVINMNYTGALSMTVGTGTSPTQAQCPSFNISANGGAALTLPAGGANNIDLTGFVGSIATSAVLVYGSLTLSSTTTVTTTTNAITLAATSGTKTITTNGVTIPRPINLNGSGSTYVLNDALTMDNAASRTFTLTAGTLNLNGKTLTTIGFVTAAGLKNITFNGGAITVFGSGATAFNNAAPTNFTTTAGAGGNGYIYMTSASAKTFAAGSSTYAATLVQAGAGALTLSGSNTFVNLKNTTQPATITFTSSTTNTFTTDFKLKGTAGSLVTITSTTAGTAATVSKSSGNVVCDYISVKDNTPAGGATWYAGPHSTRVSNYTGTNGWFVTPPSANTEFLALFT